MHQVPALFALDAAAAVIMLVLASLSKGLGEALKIKPYYQLLYFAVGLILLASLCSAIFSDLSTFADSSVAYIVPAAIRCFAGIIAVAACMRYWRWLFVEYFKK